MSQSFHFERLQHFTAGTIGPKGQRTFFLQFGNAGELVSLKLEKTQVQALGEFFDGLLEDLDPVAPADVPLALDLIDPVEVERVEKPATVMPPSEKDTVGSIPLTEAFRRRLMFLPTTRGVKFSWIPKGRYSTEIAPSSFVTGTGYSPPARNSAA